MEKVSIIVPLYNIENYIQNCIESLIRQTYKEIEIIVIDDGSTDSSMEILKQYQEDIIVFHQENQGVSYSRNKGLEKATGEYIMFVDGDDWIDSDMVESMMKIMKEEKVDIVRCGYIREYPTKKDYSILVKERKKMNKNEIYQMFLTNYLLASPWCQLIRKTCIQTLFDQNIKVGEDYLFNLSLYTQASTFVFLPNTYYHYRYNSESATTSLTSEKIEKRCKDALIVYSKLYEYLKEWNIDCRQTRNMVSYRILKELNMKLLAIFQTNCSKKEKRKMITSYFQHPLLLKAKKQFPLYMSLKYMNLYTVFLFCIKMNLKNLYYLLGKTIYYTLYVRKNR